MVKILRITLNILDRSKILFFFFLSSFPIFHSHEIPVEETCCLAIFIFKKVFYCEIPNRDLIIQLCVHRDSSDYSLFPKICNNESMKWNFKLSFRQVG